MGFKDFVPDAARSAAALVDVFGTDAGTQAATQIKRMAAMKDSEGEKLWGLIAAEIEKISQTKRPPG